MNKESQINITLCLPTYNRKTIIKTLIQSLISEEANQITKILVIDDASQDGTFDSLKEFNSIENIRIIKNTDNLGYALNFLNCFHECETEFLIIGADDDIFFKRGIEEIVKEIDIRNPDYLSTRFVSPTSTRTVSQAREIGFHEIWDSAKHATGLIYKKAAVLEHENDLIKLLKSKNLAAYFFPQIILLTLMKASDKFLLFSPHEVAGIHPTGAEKTQLVDDEGMNYLSLSNVIQRHKDFIIFYEYLLKNNSYKKYCNEIAKLIKKQRLSLYENIEAGIAIEGGNLLTDFRRGLLEKVFGKVNPVRLISKFLNKG